MHGEVTRTELELLTVSLQPKKANNLEIIKQSLRLEIERRASVSNLFSSAPFINRAEGRHKGGKKKLQSVQKSQGEFINWVLYSMNGIYKYHSHGTAQAVQSCGCCHRSWCREVLFVT